MTVMLIPAKYGVFITLVHLVLTSMATQNPSDITLISLSNDRCYL
ncbi:hypothetical protein VCR3J2_350032 [Vibrio coralliirubri]|nr:hypothetical protein VCR1J2_460041 [Vibrio coralliirubri]CDT42913.1 hypothetical protein VCR29J2_20032 [Vibrio coralliirubri]CDT90102.1 hypothetical protein VCR3J2_350032 [Vibrio coralliirubri]